MNSALILDPSIRTTAMAVGFTQDSVPRAERTVATGMPVGLHKVLETEIDGYQEEGPNYFLVGGPNPAYCRKKNKTTDEHLV
jgi:hypothetical protein